MNIIKYIRKDNKTLEYCPECMNNQLIYDYERQEVICGFCSLILRNNEFMTIKQMELASKEYQYGGENK